MKKTKSYRNKKNSDKVPDRWYELRFYYKKDPSHYVLCVDDDNDVKVWFDRQEVFRYVENHPLKDSDYEVVVVKVCRERNDKTKKSDK